jgi:hypothetical protein
MDVLVLGANDAGLEAVVDEMERAGHVVHRCAPPGMAARTGVTCVGRADDARCPLNKPIDVALLVDTGKIVDGLEPTGLGCASRDHLPIACVRPGDDPVRAATSALRERDELWATSLAGLLGTSDVRCHSVRDDRTLQVEVTVPMTDRDDPRERGRLGSRAYDVVRDGLPVSISGLKIGVSPSTS